MANESIQQSKNDSETGLEGFISSFTQYFDSGYTLADLMNIPEENMEALYSLAYQNFTAKNYKDAIAVFKVLVLYDQTEKKYTMGLAASYQQSGEFQQAADAYSMACVQSGLKDPEPMYFASVCLLKLGKKDEAVASLESMEFMGREDHPEDEKFKAKGLNLLNVIKNLKEL